MSTDDFDISGLLMQGFLKIRLVFACAVATGILAAEAHARVLIHFGFIDEEIGSALPELIKSNRETPVLAVSVEAKESKLLFQKPLEHFGHSSLVGATSGENERFSPASLLNLLNSEAYLQQRAIIYRSSVLPDVQTESGPSARYSIRAFNLDTPSKSGDLVIAVKPPEFGRQPNLLSAHIEQILTAAGALPQAANGIFISSLATGGAVMSGSLPASKFEIAGSLYFGVEVESLKGQKDALRAFVRYFDPVLQKSLVLHQSPAFASKAEAEAYLQNFLQNRSQVMGLSHPNFGISHLGEHIRRQRQDGFNISLTLSYFGTELEKSIARSFGIVNVNMEDFHVLQSAARHANAYRTVRVTTDPSQIPEAFVDEIYRWAKTEKYTLADYVEGILWGLNGSPLKTAPKRARWNIKIDAAVAKEIFFVSPELGAPLDPFFVEMSVKFIEDAANGRLIDMESISDKVLSQLTPRGQQELASLVMLQSARLSDLAREIIRIHQQNHSVENLRMKIMQLVQSAAELDVPVGTPLHGELLSLPANVGERRMSLLKSHSKLQILSQSDRPASSLSDTMDIWVRNSKWRVRINKLN
jgi:hypothetical protein